MWNQKRYETVKEKCVLNISNDIKTPHDYMALYKRMIEQEDYEGAKAVTEVLARMDFHTADMHQYIKELN